MPSDGKSTTTAEASQALICAILDYCAGPNRKKTNQHIVGNLGFKNDILPNLDENKNKLFDAFINRLRTKDKIWGKVNAPVALPSEVRNLIKLSGISVSSCISFLNSKNDWFFSSINIANSLYVQIGQKIPSWKGKLATSDFFHHRDTHEKGLMGTISNIFSVVNSMEGDYFVSRDRWCPADMYFASAEGFEILKQVKEKLIDRSKYLKKHKNLVRQNKPVEDISEPEKINIGGKKHNIEVSFKDINDLFRDLVLKNHLLPLSLKKAGSTNYLIAPVKIFNSASSSRLMASVKSSRISINFLPKYIQFGSGGKKSNFYSSIDMFIVAKPPQGFTGFRMQIRDKGGTSSNFMKEDGSGWNKNPSMQGILQYLPAEAQAGGVGQGTLCRVIGGGFDENTLSVKKFTITDICSRLRWVNNKVSWNAPARGAAAAQVISSFLNEFKTLHTRLKGRNSKVNFIGESTAPTSSKSSDILLFYVSKLANSNTNINRRRYEIAQWFYSKYFCLKLADKLTSNSSTSANSVDHKKSLFMAALSADRGGPSGKLGAGSGFFVKVG